MTALQLEPSAQAPCTNTIFGSVFTSSLPFARRTSTASQRWKRLFLRFLSRNSTLYFSKVPSLHLTTYFVHVLSNSRTRPASACSRSSVLVAAHEPGRDERRILLRNVL